MNDFLAQNIPLAPPGGFKLFGRLGLEGTDPSAAPLIFNQLIAGTIGLVSIIAFIWFLFVLITGALAVISSGGDKQKVAEARGRITTGVIGVVVIIAGVFIADLIGELLGVDILGGALLLPQVINFP